MALFLQKTNKELQHYDSKNDIYDLFFARFREIRKSKSLIYLDKMLLRIEKM